MARGKNKSKQYKKQKWGTMIHEFFSFGFFALCVVALNSKVKSIVVHLKVYLNVVNALSLRVWNLLAIKVKLYIDRNLYADSHLLNVLFGSI